MFLLHLKTVVKQLFLPPAGLLLLALLGLLLLKRRPILGRSLIIFSIATLWLLSTPMAANSLTRMAEHYPVLDLRAAAGAQTVVILGGGGQRLYAPEYGGPAAGPVLLERLSYGAFLARQTGLPVLVTGTRIEAAATRASLARNFAIQTRCCAPTPQSTNWLGNRCASCSRPRICANTRPSASDNGSSIYPAQHGRATTCRTAGC
jgi:uncharacterized SAM-binding protein YcdF (DUF218 family)